MPYQDTTFNPAPYAASIGDLMLHSADAQAHAAAIIGAARARAAEVSGQAWAGAAQAAGNAPAQAVQAQNTTLDTKLKQEALSEQIEQRKVESLGRITQLVGRTAASSRTPDEFKANIKDLAVSGVLPPDAAARIMDRTDQAGPDGFDAHRQSYMDFADQFAPLTTVKPGETVGRVGVSGAFKPVVSAPQIVPLRANESAAAISQPTAPGAQPTASILTTAPGTPGQGQHVVNGQVVGPLGEKVGEAIPKQETQTEIDERHARMQEIDLRSKELQARLSGTLPLSEKDKAELELAKQRLQIEKTSLDMREKREDVNSAPNQQKLEQQYRSLAQMVVRTRSGALGVEDGKVGAAKHALTLLDQGRNPDGTYDLARIQRRELATNLAKLIQGGAGGGGTGEGQINELDQRTLQGDMADMLTYMTGNPKLVNAAPQEVAKLFRDSIVRQGQTAEANREHELDFIRSARPMDLQPERAVGIENGMAGLNKISDVMPGGRDYKPRMFKMRSKDGSQVQDVPVDNVNHFLNLGATIVKQ